MAGNESVFAVMMVRDEEDVIEPLICHLVDELVDGIVVADNRSVDGTSEAISRGTRYADDHGVELIALHDPEPGYYQSKKMTGLGQIASSLGATWIVPVDADEIWYAQDGPLGEVLRAEPSNSTLAVVRILNHYPTVHDQPGIPFESMRWRTEQPQPLHKVAVRWEPDAVIEQGNHSAQLPMRGHVYTGQQLLIRHFPYRNPEQFVRKAANGAEAYGVTDLPPDMGRHWRQYGALLDTGGPTVLQDVFNQWFYFPEPEAAGLIEDPAPYRRWRR